MMNCPASGNTPTMRSTVLEASMVCSVLMTRCPVSAASKAISMVSLSRISTPESLLAPAQCRAQGEGETGCITVQFSLMNDGAFVAVHKLHWIFDGNDVISMGFVDTIQNCRHGR